MCSLEHDTCANMFSSGLHKRQQKHHSKNSISNPEKPVVMCYVLFYAISFKDWPTASSEPLSQWRRLETQKSSTVSFPCNPGQALL